MVYKIVLTLLLVLLSGCLGRMGGAGKSGQWYDRFLDTLWRDIGCTLVLLSVVLLWCPWQPSFWYMYLISGLLTYGSFTTYWDELFGYDCMWFSGMCVGVAGLPLMWVAGDLWWLFPCRIAILAIVWGLLNKFLPQKVWLWRRDVAEENLRYMASL